MLFGTAWWLLARVRLWCAVAAVVAVARMVRARNVASRTAGAITAKFAARDLAMGVLAEPRRVAAAPGGDRFSSVSTTRTAAGGDQVVAVLSARTTHNGRFITSVANIHPAVAVDQITGSVVLRTHTLRQANALHSVVGGVLDGTVDVRDAQLQAQTIMAITAPA